MDNDEETVEKTPEEQLAKAIKPVPEEEAKKKLVDLRDEIERSAYERAIELRKSEELKKRIAAAEEIIRQKTKERMDLAAKTGGSAGIEALLSHFMMGGGAAKVGEYSVETPSLKVVALKVAGGFMALRIEENPLYPVFALASSHGSRLTDGDHRVIALLERTLKLHCKAFFYINDARMSDLATNLQWK